jgi:hypothetical protein
MSTLEIGCCGAYCGTCPEYRKARCRGCKIGYESGERDIRRARCRMKICCIEKGLETCADCDDYVGCRNIREFYGKNAYKYRKYREATLFIRERGYQAFLEIATGWEKQYGKY